MRPSARSLVCGERWSGGANRRFAALVGGCTLLVKVFSAVHSVLHADVYRYFGVQDFVSVRDVLVDEGYAELADECYESKVRVPAGRPALPSGLPLRPSESDGGSWRWRFPVVRPFPLERKLSVSTPPPWGGV